MTCCEDVRRFYAQSSKKDYEIDHSFGLLTLSGVNTCVKLLCVDADAWSDLHEYFYERVHVSGMLVLVLLACMV